MLDSLFTYRINKNEPGTLEAQVSINADHDIFKGHFPGYPVMPGVCMVQIIEQVFSDVRKKKYLLSNAKSIKFLSLFSPKEVSEVKATIQYSADEDGHIKMNASLHTNDTTYFKLKGLLREREVETDNTKI